MAYGSFEHSSSASF